MSQFRPAPRNYPPVTTHQGIDLRFLNDIGNQLQESFILLPQNDRIRFNSNLQELIDIVINHDLLRIVENERILAQQDGIVSIDDPGDIDLNEE